MTPNIRSFEPIVPMIYAYTHPDYFPHAGRKKGVERRPGTELNQKERR